MEKLAVKKARMNMDKKVKRKSPLDAKKSMPRYFPTVLDRLAKNHARSAHST